MLFIVSQVELKTAPMRTLQRRLAIARAEGQSNATMLAGSSRRCRASRHRGGLCDRCRRRPRPERGRRVTIDDDDAEDAEPGPPPPPLARRNASPPAGVASATLTRWSLERRRLSWSPGPAAQRRLVRQVPPLHESVTVVPGLRSDARPQHRALHSGSSRGGVSDSNRR